MIIRITLILGILLIFLSQSFPQQDPEEVLKNIQDKFNTINDLSADLVQSVNGNANLKGKIYYKKENQLRFEFKNILLISDGETSWSYNPKNNKVVITDYESEGDKILSIRQIIFDYPENCNLTTEQSEGTTILLLIPNDNTFSFNSIKLFLSEDYLITKASIDDPAAGEIEIDLSDYKLNKGLSDSLFKFSPPEGSQVIDLR